MKKILLITLVSLMSQSVFAQMIIGFEPEHQCTIDTYNYILNDTDGDGVANCIDQCPDGTMIDIVRHRLLNATFNPTDYDFETASPVPTSKNHGYIVRLKDMRIHHVAGFHEDFFWSYDNDNFWPIRLSYFLEFDMVVDIYEVRPHRFYPVLHKELVEENYAFQGTIMYLADHAVEKVGQGLVFSDNVEPTVDFFVTHSSVEHRYSFLEDWVEYQQHNAYTDTFASHTVHSPYQFLLNNFNFLKELEKDLRFYNEKDIGCLSNYIHWQELKADAY